MTDEVLTALVREPGGVARRRAALVQDALVVGPTRAAELHGVTRRTATKWLSRYRAAGAAGLATDDRRRRARDEVRRTVLTAPLWMPTPKWSSRSVADRLGVSQATVARVWADASAGSDLAERLAARIEPTQATLAGLLVGPPGTVVVVRRALPIPGEAGAVAVPARPRTVRRLRAVVAAGVAGTATVTGGGGTGEVVAAGAIGIPVDTGPRPDRVDVFWERVLAGAPSPVDLAVAASGNVTVPAALRPATVHGDASGWTALLPYLAGCREGAIGPPAADLETRLRQWHRSGRGWFSWVADDVEPGPPDAPEESASTRRPSPERALADDVVATIRAGVREGRFAGGDHVTDRYLAERLHTTRGQIRSALRLLERDGLVTAIAGHAAVIPIPTTADVVETYAARRALGVLMVRAATRWTPSGRKAVLAVLEELDRCAVDDDVERANRLDQTFQVALADASGLTRIGPMLGLLSDQILMFIAVIGIRYAFPTEGIVRRDHELFAAVDAGDLDGAVESWRAKMDESASYMLQLLEDAGRRRRLR